MLKKEIADLINEQINKELYSAYLYLDMANYYAEEGLSGFENWFYVQAQEEMDHAMLFRTYLLNNECSILLEAIQKPGLIYDGFDAPLKEAYKHEQTVTASIYNIYDAASQNKDFRTTQFLDWFVMEQGEEEKNTADLIKKFELFGHDSKGLYTLNQEMAARVYSAPSLVI